MKKTVFAATLAVLFTANVQANTVGLYLGGQIWQSEARGVFGEKNALVDFNLKKEQQNNYFIAFVHPYQLLPNLRISRTSFGTKGKTTLTQAFSFGDEAFTMGENIDARFNVSYVDYTLYYQLLDNDLFSFDLGLSARDFNGSVTVMGAAIIGDNCLPTNNPNVCVDNNNTNSVIPAGKIKTDEIEPTLYIATNISLPLTGLSVFGQGDFSLRDDHSIFDYQVGLSYDLVDSIMVDLNLTLGYRAVKMEFEKLDKLYTDLEFKGAFVGVILHF